MSDLLKPKKKPGRPRVGPNKMKDFLISCYFQEGQYEEITELAARMGLSRSQLIRLVTLEYLEKRKKEAL